jgi:hypothetical protein
LLGCFRAYFTNSILHSLPFDIPHNSGISEAARFTALSNVDPLFEEEVKLRKTGFFVSSAPRSRATS